MGSMFTGAKNVVISEKGTNLAADLPLGQEATHLVEITRITMPPNLTNGDAYICEYKVLESSSDPVGATRRWYQSMRNKQVALPACCSFIFAASGYDRRADAKAIEELVKPEVEGLLDQSYDEGDPLHFVGRKLRIKTKKVKTKPKPGAPDGFEFIQHDFAPGQEDKLF